MPTGRFLTNLEAVFAEAAVEGGGRDAEELGGFAAVPAGFFEGADYLLALDVAKIGW